MFGCAAIYEPGNDTIEDRPGCAILTTAANPLVNPSRQHMPVILCPNDYGDWLAPAAKLPKFESMLTYKAVDLIALPVSPVSATSGTKTRCSSSRCRSPVAGCRGTYPVTDGSTASYHL